MIETLAVITVAESAQNYGRELETLDRVFKIEYDITKSQHTNKTQPSARLEELAGSTYAYRENIALKTIGNAVDVRTASAEHDELLEALLTMAETRIPTYIEGTIESMETDVREHTVNLDAELALRS
jgi:hypothetical protein